MHVRGSLTFEELIRIWLGSEWHKIRLAAWVDRGLIDNADISDPIQNYARYGLLCSERWPILLPLPQDSLVLDVIIERADLPQLYIVPSDDWYHDTGGTFRLLDAIKNCTPGSSHYDKMQAITTYRRENIPVSSDERIVLVSASEAGPFTIIDGNHRAVSAFSDKIPDGPVKAILVCDPRIGGYRWFINSPITRQWIQQWASQPPLAPFSI